MKWHLMTVPVLPAEGIDFVDAPFPFIIGTNLATWKEIEDVKMFSLSEDIFLLNLDENKVQMKELLPQMH